MTNAAHLATRYARRPLLLEPTAALEILRHIQASDPRGMRTEGRLDAVLRKIGLGKANGVRPVPLAMEDDDYAAAPAPTSPAAYIPLWAQQAYGEPEDEGFAWALIQGVATMQIDTAISDRGEFFCGQWFHGYDTLLAGMSEALADPRVGGLFIRMRSPGGVVAGGLDDLAAFMRANRAQAGGKPIHVYADMAGSAAYWIAAQADRIVAPRVGLVGSIGAVILHEDYSGMLAKEGVVVTPIQFGDSKTDFAGWKALSAGALADIQTEIDQCGANFVADVTAGRPQLTAEALIATQARVFMAQHDDPTRSGLALGFVDAISSEQEAFAELLARVASPAAPAKPPKDTNMATQNRQQRRAHAARLRASASAAEAEAGAPAAGMEDCETCDGTGEVDGKECPDCEGSGEMEAKAPPPPPADGPADASAAIAASAEAKTHPALALAAIGSKQSLAQFQATVAAVGATPKPKGNLDAQMETGYRLGPDGEKTAPAATLDASAIYGKRHEAVHARH